MWVSGVNPLASVGPSHQGRRGQPIRVIGVKPMGVIEVKPIRGSWGQAHQGWWAQAYEGH